MKLHLSLLILPVMFWSLPSHAQSSLEGFSTGRYEIHKDAKAKKSRAPSNEDVTERAPLAVEDDDAPVVQAKKPAVAVKAVAKSADSQKAVMTPTETAPVAKSETAAGTDTAKTPQVDVEKPVAKSANGEELEEPGVVEQAKSLFTAKTDKVYDFYAEQVHPDDVRQNRVELQFSPTVIYNDSSSNYSFRKYQSFFDAMDVKAKVWVTPLLGISGRFLFSLAADIDSLDTQHSRVSTKYEMMEWGIHFRRFFGLSRKSNSLELSLLFADDKMDVPGDTQNRPSLKTSGLGLGLKARFPTSASYAWVLGGSFYPRMQHGEDGNAQGISSGTSPDNTRMGADFGGEWKFNRENQMIWNLGITSEKNLFEGTASVPDPSTGVSPSNVSVTNTFYMLSLGYRWGH